MIPVPLEARKEANLEKEVVAGRLLFNQEGGLVVIRKKGGG